MFQYAVYSFQKYVSLLAADAYIVLKILLYFVFAQFEIKQSFNRIRLFANVSHPMKTSSTSKDIDIFDEECYQAKLKLPNIIHAPNTHAAG
jgi:hypothetical protein